MTGRGDWAKKITACDLVNLIVWCQKAVDDKTTLRLFHSEIPKIGMADTAALAKLNC